MRRSLYLCTIFSLMSLLASCAYKMKSDVVTFHEGPLPRGETIRVEPMDDLKRGSLEFEHYAESIRSNLRKIGYTPVKSGQPAQLVAQIDYSVSEGQTQVRSDTRGYTRYHFYYGHNLSPFYYGFYNDWPSEIYTYPVYNRLLLMNISRFEGKREVLFEGRVQSVGREKEIAKIMPYLITAMFTNFPGESGVTKVVTVETQ